MNKATQVIYDTFMKNISLGTLAKIRWWRKLAFIVLTLGWEETILRPKCKAIIDWNLLLNLYPKIKKYSMRY